MKVYQGEHVFVALLDTGAKANLMHKRVWNRIKHYGNFPALKPSTMRLRGIGNTPVIPDGTITVPIKLGNSLMQVEFLVIDTMSLAFILNSSFIHHYLEPVKSTDGKGWQYKVQATGEILQRVQPEYMYPPDFATCAETTTIPANKQFVIPFLFDSVFQRGEKLKLDPFYLAKDTRVHATSFVYRSYDQYVVEVSNSTGADITVPHGCPMGQIVSADCNIQLNENGNPAKPASSEALVQTEEPAEVDGQSWPATWEINMVKVTPEKARLVTERAAQTGESAVILQPQPAISETTTYLHRNQNPEDGEAVNQQLLPTITVTPPSDTDDRASQTDEPDPAEREPLGDITPERATRMLPPFGPILKNRAIPDVWWQDLDASSSDSDPDDRSLRSKSDRGDLIRGSWSSISSSDDDRVAYGYPVDTGEGCQHALEPPPPDCGCPCCIRDCRCRARHDPTDARFGIPAYPGPGEPGANNTALEDFHQQEKDFWDKKTKDGIPNHKGITSWKAGHYSDPWYPLRNKDGEIPVSSEYESPEDSPPDMVGRWSYVVDKGEPCQHASDKPDPHCECSCCEAHCRCVKQWVPCYNVGKPIYHGPGTYHRYEADLREYTRKKWRRRRLQQAARRGFRPATAAQWPKAPVYGWRPPKYPWEFPAIGESAYVSESDFSDGEACPHIPEEDETSELSEDEHHQGCACANTDITPSKEPRPCTPDGARNPDTPDKAHPKKLWTERWGSQGEFGDEHSSVDREVEQICARARALNEERSHNKENIEPLAVPLSPSDGSPPPEARPVPLVLNHMFQVYEDPAIQCIRDLTPDSVEVSPPQIPLGQGEQSGRPAEGRPQNPNSSTTTNNDTEVHNLSCDCFSCLGISDLIKEDSGRSPTHSLDCDCQQCRLLEDFDLEQLRTPAGSTPSDLHSIDISTLDQEHVIDEDQYVDAELWAYHRAEVHPECNIVDCGFCNLARPLVVAALGVTTKFDDEATHGKPDPGYRLPNKDHSHVHGADGCNSIPEPLQLLADRSVQNITQLVNEGAPGTKMDRLQEYCKQIRETLARNCALFARDDLDLGCVPPETYQAKFDIRPGPQIRPKAIKYSPQMAQVVQEEVDRLVARDVLEEVTEPSEHSINLFPVKKKVPLEETLQPGYKPKMRIVGDSRDINKRIITPNIDVPSIDELVIRLSGFNLYALVDLKLAFFSITLEEETSRKITSVVMGRAYRWKRLTMGLVCSPFFLVNCVSIALKAILRTHPGLVNYFDDIAEGSNDMDDLIQKLDELLTVLRKTGFTVNPFKAVMFTQEIKFVGWTISKHGRKPDKKAVESVVNAPVPRTKRMLQSWIGMVLWLRKIGGHELAIPLRPLHELAAPNTIYTWNQDAQQCFDLIKKAMTDTTKLGVFVHGRKKHLFCDSSGVHAGATLMQEVPADEAKKRGLPEQPEYKGIHLEVLAYYSRCVPRRHSETWCPVQLELWAIVGAVQTLWEYIRCQDVVIYTDNRAAFYILTAKKHALKHQYFRIASELSDVQHTVEYVRGVDNLAGDGPSRMGGCPDECTNCRRSLMPGVPLQKTQQTQVPEADRGPKPRRVLLPQVVKRHLVKPDSPLMGQW